MAVADFPDPAEIRAGSRYRAQAGAHNRLRDKSRDVLGTVFKNGLPQRRCAAFTILFFTLFRVLVTVGKTGFNPGPFPQQGAIGRPAIQVTGDRQRAQRVAVVALPAADDDMLLIPAARQPVLPGQFDRGLIGLRPTGQEINPRTRFAESARQLFGKAFLWMIGKKRRVREGHFTQLLFDSLQNLRVAMAQAGNGRATAAIQVLPAFSVI